MSRQSIRSPNPFFKMTSLNDFQTLTTLHKVGELKQHLAQLAWRVQSAFDAVDDLDDITPFSAHKFCRGILTEIRDAEFTIGQIAVLCKGAIFLNIPEPILVVKSCIRDECVLKAGTITTTETIGGPPFEAPHTYW
ncbi:hypothetical protein EUX98_g8293 [Antrodiella citrinella]|uniref:Uncharacterized protein n=1 Tax=Antrodiella citrinella TaxID=2447956 RepID=A0A4S4M8K6_9APHY|nr:hypothetical protein EUX98_g8293 [Antrodiella citrinella]